MKTSLILLVFLTGAVGGSLFTYWVHPFAKVATYVEVQKPELEVRADNYKRCMQFDTSMNAKGKVETTWKCKNGDVFYTTTQLRTYYEQQK